MVVSLKRNQGIVLGRRQESRNANAIQKLFRGLRGVVVVRCAESEALCGELVIKLIDALHAVEVFDWEQSGCQAFLEPDALLKAAEESVGMNEVCGAVEMFYTSCQV